MPDYAARAAMAANHGQQLQNNTTQGQGAWDPGATFSGPQSWQNFSFQNPTEDWQRNFNSLSGVDKFKYGFGGSTGNQAAMKAGLLGSGIDPATVNQISSTFLHGGGDADSYYRQLGLSANPWDNASGGQQGMFQNGSQLFGVRPGANGAQNERYLIKDFGNASSLANAAQGSAGYNASLPALSAGGTWSAQGAHENQPAAGTLGSALGGFGGSGSSPVAWNPAAGGTTGGNMAPGSGPPGQVGGAITAPGAGSGAYPLDIARYLDPSADWETQQGLRSLASSAAAGGQTFSGNNQKGIVDYAQGRARTNWNNAAQLAAQQQGFGRGVDTNNRDFARGVYTNDRDFTQNQNVGDRNFAYQAQLNDQTIPWQQQMQLAQLGMQGQQGATSAAGTLAALLSGNLNTQGQAQGAGTIGGNNSLTQMISQILASMNQNNLYNRILPGT